MIEEITPTVHHVDQHSAVYSMSIQAFNTDDRIRSQLGEINEFAAKLRDEGQQNPITFETRDGVPHLNTGYRRWAAAGLLAVKNEFIGMKLPEGNPRRVGGVGEVLARDVGAMDDIERLVLELSENNSRKDFSQAENALGIAKLQKLLQTKHERPFRVTELAERLNMSIGQVGMGLKVAAHVNSAPDTELSRKMMKAPSIKSAYDTLSSTKKLDELRDRASKTRTIGDVESRIGHTDGLAFLRSLADSSVDFINFDPPWGVGIDDYDRHHKHENFDDSPEYAWNSVILPMIPELYRVLKTDTWAVIWFGIQYYNRLTEALETLAGRVKPGKGFKVDPVPGIWYKTNKGGSQSNPDLTELNVYEPFFRIRKGDPRLFKKAVTNVIECPMDYGQSRDHFAQKPVALSEELLARYSFGSMMVIDPTYGSGRFFKAAQKLGRNFAGAEKSEANRQKCLVSLKTID